MSDGGVPFLNIRYQCGIVIIAKIGSIASGLSNPIKNDIGTLIMS